MDETEEQRQTVLQNLRDIQKKGDITPNDFEAIKHGAQLLLATTVSEELLEVVSAVIVELFAMDSIKKIENVKPVMENLFVFLKTNPDARSIHKNIFKAIGNLTDHEEPSQIWLVSEYDAINILMNVIKQSYTFPDLQAQALYALQKLVKGNIANIQALFKLDGHELARDCIEKQDSHADVQIQACAILRRLSFFSEINTELIKSVCSTVLGAMQAHISLPELLENCFVFLTNVAFDEATKKQLVEPPYMAHVIILQGMRMHPQHAVAQERGCGVLSRLALLHSNKNLLTQQPHKAHAAVLDAMATQFHNASVQEKGCCALGNLALNDDNEKMLSTAPYFAHVSVLSAMRENPLVEAVQLKACRAIRNLTSNPGNKRMITGEPHRAHEAILAAMRTHVQNAGIQEYGCSALLSLAVDDDNEKLLVCEPYLAHEAITTAMRKHIHCSSVQEQGCHALRNLSSDSNNKKLIMCEPYLAHQAILTAMIKYPFNLIIQRQGCIALKNLAHDDDNKQVLMQEPYLAHEAVLSAMRSNPQDALVQQEGCGALINFAFDDANERTLVKCGTQIVIMAALRHHMHIEGVALQAVWALANLSCDESTQTVFLSCEMLPLCQRAGQLHPDNAKLVSKIALLEARFEHLSFE